MVLGSGCLDEGGTEEKGTSAISASLLAETEKEQLTGHFELVAATALEPSAGGRARTWKFSYNGGTAAGTPPRIAIIVDPEGTATDVAADHDEKDPVKNWSIDSTSAYSRTVEDLINDGVITSNTPIKVSYLYLLGDNLQNDGCEWYIGLILGSQEPINVQYRIDGSTGEVLQRSQ
jgi:hypothetical protein